MLGMIKLVISAITNEIWELPTGGEKLVQLFVTALTVWIAGQLLDKRSFTDFGLNLNKNWWIDFVFGLSLGGFLITLIFAIELIFGWIEVTGIMINYNQNSLFIISLISSVGIFVVVGLEEELLFRGYIFTNLAEGFNLKHFDPKWALLFAISFSTILFSVAHLGNAHMSMMSLVSVTLAGIFLAIGYILTGKLAISMGLHITWNLFQNSIFGFTVSGTQISTASVFTIKQQGPELWVGNEFGPESGLLAIMSVLLGCFLIIAWIRMRYGEIKLHAEISTYSHQIPNKLKGE